MKYKTFANVSYFYKTEKKSMICIRSKIQNVLERENERKSIFTKRIMFDRFILFQQTGKAFNEFYFFLLQKEKY